MALAQARGADPARLYLVHPGVDLPPPARVPRSTRPTVLTIARMRDRYKGHDVMLRALPAIIARLPDALWVVVGDGPLRGWYEREAARLGLGAHVRFVKSVSDEERDAWLGQAHVLAMPSRLPARGGGEGFGIAYLEAGAHGLPVVAGNTAGAVDAVVDGETGLLVDPTNPAAVAGAVCRLLLDADFAKRLGEAGAARARQFAWPRAARQVEELLLLAAPSPA
jgi:phosphatidylinositol alpha-1,6-mannosyltransferase